MTKEIILHHPDPNISIGHEDIKIVRDDCEYCMADEKNQEAIEIARETFKKAKLKHADARYHRNGLETEVERNRNSLKVSEQALARAENAVEERAAEEYKAQIILEALGGSPWS